MPTPYGFSIGELVSHQRYGYRGVIAGCDPRCEADELWYQNNLTQPSREQPWYHVLVDGSTSTTYAAEENLQADWTPVAVVHPLVEVFFDGFAGGHYLRNHREFTGWEA